MAAARSPRPVAVRREPARHLPVARVAVDISLPHLDRPFDYLVAADDDAAAHAGVRVRVRFSGRLVDGYVLERVERSDHTGTLAFLHRVISPEVVLVPAVARLARAVADRYAGSLADVLRLAVPPRHGRTENESVAEEPASVVPAHAVVDAQDDVPVADAPHPATDQPIEMASGWSAYQAGAAFTAAVAAGRPARAVWTALPGEEWAARLAELAATAFRAGRGALLLVPDARDLGRLDAALADRLPRGHFMTLSADLGPAARYRRFLAVSRGRVRVVAGTRAAAFAPVRDLGLIAIFDDGDDLYAEPRAPYPHAREVAMLRSAQEGSALLVGGFARTAEAAMLIESGWARAITADRDRVRRSSPRLEGAGDDYAVGADSGAARARLTPAAFAAARQALDAGAPVLVQVPRGGYLPALVCAECRRAARCRRCSGPLAIPHGARTPGCRWCGATVPRWACPACASTRLRASVTGAGRTAEEIGRAFPGVRLVTSAAGTVQERVDAAPAIVVATPGAEPVAADGYGAALLLDGALMLARADLRAAEETLRRWMNAVTLVRPGERGGRVVIGADATLPVVQALLRWDAAGHSDAELAARRELGFPPAVAMASVGGSESAVGAALAGLELPATAQVLGPVPVFGSSEVRALIRAPLAARKELASALRVLAAARSIRKDEATLRIQMDPAELG